MSDTSRPIRMSDLLVVDTETLINDAELTTLRARLAEVERERDGLRDVLRAKARRWRDDVRFGYSDRTLLKRADELERLAAKGE